MRHNNIARNNIVCDVGGPNEYKNTGIVKYLWIRHNPLDGSIFEKNIYSHPGVDQLFISIPCLLIKELF